MAVRSAAPSACFNQSNRVVEDVDLLTSQANHHLLSKAITYDRQYVQADIRLCGFQDFANQATGSSLQVFLS